MTIREMNSTKMQNPQRVNELYIGTPPPSMKNSEELAQPQRRLEKRAVLH